MQYIKRFIESDFLNWKNTNRVGGHKYALEVTGSGQIGKTTTVLHFAEENYDNVVYVDVSNNSEVGSILNDNFHSVEDRVSQYCRLKNIKFTNDQCTALIFDEVQESAELFSSIRLFNRGLNCDLIITGSNLQKTIGLFQPAGDLIEMRMYPLSYEEYLEYFSGYEYYCNEDINTICDEKIEWYKNVYKAYSIVGGYPSVFLAYLEGRELNEAFESIIKAFQSEFRVTTKNPADYDKIEIMFETICEVLCREKKGNARILDMVSKITEQSKNKRISAEECNNILAWLSAARIINFCDKVDLKDNKKYPSERFYFDDIGLLNYICTKMNMDKSAISGIIAENFIFKQLKDGRYNNRFYGSRPSFAVDANDELDFLVTSKIDDCVYGIEVKSGNNSGVSIKRSLDNQKINYAVYAKGGITKYSEQENVYSVPIFLFNKFTFDKGGIKEKEELPRITVFSK